MDVRVVESGNNPAALQIDYRCIGVFQSKDFSLRTSASDVSTGYGNCFRLRLSGILCPDLAVIKDEVDFGEIHASVPAPQARLQQQRTKQRSLTCMGLELIRIKNIISTLIVGPMFS